MEETNGVVWYRHQRTPSSDRFIGVFSQPSSSGESSVAGDDLTEDDVFWTGDFTQKTRQSTDSVNRNNRSVINNQSLRNDDKSGILASLPEDNDHKPNRPMLNRRNTTIASPTMIHSTSSRSIPSIPRPIKQDRDVSQSMPVIFRQSAPVNVPVFVRKTRIGGELADVDIADDDDEEEMLPPHEMVARLSSPHTTFSVLEGAGRTLKGRDLRLVRNAVLRKTGFLD